MGQGSLRFHGKLDVVPICPFDQSNPLNLALWEGSQRTCFLALGVRSCQIDRSNAHAIGERQMLAIGSHLPTSGLVFNGAIIVLKMRVALFAWFLFAAVFIEAGNG